MTRGEVCVCRQGRVQQAVVQERCGVASRKRQSDNAARPAGVGWSPRRHGWGRLGRRPPSDQKRRRFKDCHHRETARGSLHVTRQTGIDWTLNPHDTEQLCATVSNIVSTLAMPCRTKPGAAKIVCKQARELSDGAWGAMHRAAETDMVKKKWRKHLTIVPEGDLIRNCE